MARIPTNYVATTGNQTIAWTKTFTWTITNSSATSLSIGTWGGSTPQLINMWGNGCYIGQVNASFKFRSAFASKTFDLINTGNTVTTFSVALDSWKVTLDATNTAGWTTGNQTINKPTGTVNIAAAGTTVTVTNSLVTTSSIVFAVLRTNDATATIKNVVPWSGSFVINLGAAATAEVSIGFIVYN